MKLRRLVVMKEVVHSEAGKDAPRPDEIVVVIGIADGGRVNPRVGKGRIL